MDQSADFSSTGKEAEDPDKEGVEHLTPSQKEAVETTKKPFSCAREVP